MTTPKKTLFLVRPFSFKSLTAVDGKSSHIPAFIFDLDLGIAQNIAQYPLHYVTFAPAKFEVAMCNSLGGNKLTRKYIICPLTLASRSHEILPSTLYIMRPMHLQHLKLLRPTVMEQMHLQENTVLDLDLGFQLTQDVVQHTLYHATYAFAKFNAATFND